MAELTFEGVVEWSGKRLTGKSSVITHEEFIAYMELCDQAHGMMTQLEAKVPKGWRRQSSVVTLPYYENPRFKVVVKATDQPEVVEKIEEPSSFGIPVEMHLGLGLNRVLHDFPVGTRVIKDESRRGGRERGSVVGYRLSRFNKKAWFLLVERAASDTAYMWDPDKTIVENGQ